jgi:hypothetical protein
MSIEKAIGIILFQLALALIVIKIQPTNGIWSIIGIIIYWGVFFIILSIKEK